MRSESGRCVLLFLVGLLTGLFLRPTTAQDRFPASSLPDPFRPPTNASAAEPNTSATHEPISLKPQMILTEGQNRWVRVGGEWLQPGSEYHGYRLKAITLTHIIWQTPDGGEQIQPLTPIPLTLERMDGLAAP